MAIEGRQHAMRHEELRQVWIVSILPVSGTAGGQMMKFLMGQRNYCNAQQGHHQNILSMKR